MKLTLLANIAILTAEKLTLNSVQNRCLRLISKMASEKAKNLCLEMNSVQVSIYQIEYFAFFAVACERFYFLGGALQIRQNA